MISLNFRKNFFASPLSVTKCLTPKTSWATLLKPFLWLKILSILITLMISFSFNHAIIFCINTCVTVLINQYSTGLFVSYYSVQRKTQFHETSLQKEWVYILRKVLWYWPLVCISGIRTPDLRFMSQVVYHCTKKARKTNWRGC